MKDSDQIDRKHCNISIEDFGNSLKTSGATVSGLDDAESVKNRLPKKIDHLNPPSEEWDYNLYRKEEFFQYIDEDDLISSDDNISGTDLIGNNVRKKVPKKFNQLNPSVKFIQKQLKSAKPKTKNLSIWKPLEVSSSIHSVNRSLCSDMDIGSSESMEENSKKRKRNPHSVDKEDVFLSQRKKVKGSNNNATKEFVNRKEQAHSLSSSDSECNKERTSKNYSVEKSLESNHHKNQQPYLLTSDENSGSVSKSSKKHKSSKKTTNFTYSIKDEFNHSLSTDESFSNNTPKQAKNFSHDQNKSNHHLSSDEGSSKSINKSSPKCKVLQKFNNNFVKSEHDVEEINESRSQIIETDQSNEGSTSENKHKLKHNNITIQVQDKSVRKLVISQDDEEELSKYSFLLDRNLAEKNNIWILQCPNSLDCADLVSQSLDLTGRGSAHLKVCETVFEAYSYRDNTNRSATLAVPSSSNQLHLCKIPISGNIIIEESVDITNKKSFPIPDPPQRVEFPQNLRIRHPLLGVDYERKASVSSFPKPKKELPKKKKRSKSFNESVYSNGMQEGDLEPPLEEYEVKKKKHKKKK